MGIAAVVRSCGPARLAAAKLFKAQKVKLPLYPAYEVAATEVELAGSGSLDGMIEAATKDPAFAREWKASLALAADVVKGFDRLPRAQVAPAVMDELVAADGLQIPDVRDIVGDDVGLHAYDEGALRLPLLDYVSTMFADQLRVLDVKDKVTIDEFLREKERCKADVTWVSRSQPKEQTGPARVQALVIGRCAKVSTRDGSFWGHAIELYVYDAAGRLALSVADGHIDGYRWITDGDRPMLAGGLALLGQGKRIEAKKREAVARAGSRTAASTARAATCAPARSSARPGGRARRTPPSRIRASARRRSAPTAISSRSRS